MVDRGRRERERERKIDRKTKRNSNARVGGRREANGGHHSRVSPFRKLRLHADEPRKIVRGLWTGRSGSLTNFSAPLRVKVGSGWMRFQHRSNLAWCGGWGTKYNYVSSSYFLLPSIFSTLFKQDKLLPLYCYFPFLLPFSEFLFTFSFLS